MRIDPIWLVGFMIVALVFIIVAYYISEKGDD